LTAPLQWLYLSVNLIKLYIELTSAGTMHNFGAHLFSLDIQKKNRVWYEIDSQCALSSSIFAFHIQQQQQAFDSPMVRMNYAHLRNTANTRHQSQTVSHLPGSSSSIEISLGYIDLVFLPLRSLLCPYTGQRYRDVRTLHWGFSFLLGYSGANEGIGE
jgi:hypothetical protein